MMGFVMTEPTGRAPQAYLTLLLTTILHAFTHAYGAMLVPLYLLMTADLRLPGVKRAALVVTAYMLVYSIGSYGAGVLADRMSRRNLLGWGLVANAAAIVGMGLTRDYSILLLLAVVAGTAGTIFHPAANSLVPEHFPKSPGMAIGLLGMGSGLGFFAGPQYAGWRAEAAHWHLWHVANWQRPCVELGAMGFIMGVIFLALAREARSPAPREQGSRRKAHPPLGRALRWKVLAIASILSFRDFAGIASLSLASIYLQKAQGFDARRTGFIIGAMMLIGIAANPLAVYLTPGRRRLPGLVVVLIAGGAAIACVPRVGREHVLAALCIFQGFQLGSYAISDAAMLERVHANVRGRVVGLFLMIAGTFAGTSPWAMGFWTDTFGPAAAQPLRYMTPFVTLGIMMVVASLAVPIIARLGTPDVNAIDPLSEIQPRTMEAVV
jgi:MFS family permease